MHCHLLSLRIRAISLMFLAGTISFMHLSGIGLLGNNNGWVDGWMGKELTGMGRDAFSVEHEDSLSCLVNGHTHEHLHSEFRALQVRI